MCKTHVLIYVLDFLSNIANNRHFIFKFIFILNYTLPLKLSSVYKKKKNLSQFLFKREIRANNAWLLKGKKKL